jgi:beta-glucosidase
MDNYSFAERAADLVSRMTLEEKRMQTDHKANAVERLGVPAYDYWSEGLHGVARSGYATVFPTAIGMATSWNVDLVERIAAVTADEARAYNNEKGKGLSYWSPTINLARDPRWGRAEETYGEDPYLTAQMGIAFVKGLEAAGENAPYIKAIATIKHFAANNSENNRHTGSANMDERTLREYYTRTFQRIVECTRVHSLMTAYNRLNEVPMSANVKLLQHMLRETWGFDGYVVSDCGAIGDVFRNHNWIPDGMDHPVDADEAVGKTIPAGTDLCCGTDYEYHVIPAIEKGYMTEDQLDIALQRAFYVRMQTGEFDDPAEVPYRSDAYSWNNQIGTPEHVALARQASEEGVALLKNEPAKGEDKPLLPLNGKSIHKLVVYGEAQLADALVLGDYSGTPLEETVVKPLQGITAAAKAANPDVEVTYIHPSNTAAFFANVRNISIKDDRGDEMRLLTPAEVNHTYDCMVQDGKNFGYVGLHMVVRYDQVPLDGVVSIGIETSGSPAETTQGMIEVRMDSRDGPLITTIESKATGGWEDYREYTGTLTQIYTGKHDLYFRAVANAAYEPFTPEQRQTIAAADAVIAYVGTRQGDSREDYDRNTMEMARYQSDAVCELLSVNPRTAVYISAVGQVDIESFRREAPSILWCTYNGQAQGTAAGDLLFGNANPSGKMTFSWYTDESEMPHINDYTIRSGGDYPGRTYQYYTKQISYPFGHGLSYTAFDYQDVTLDKTAVTPDDTLTVSFTLKNVGERDGAEVAQVYVSSPGANRFERPIKELKGFTKVFLKAGESRRVTIDLPVVDWYFWNDERQKDWYDQGAYTVSVGASSEDIRARLTVELSGQLTERIKTVKANPDKVCLRGVGDHLRTRLTAVMNTDAVFNEWERARVEWSVNRPEVVSVDVDGIVTGLKPGLATVTAAVTVDGVTATDSFAVAVTA